MRTAAWRTLFVAAVVTLPGCKEGGHRVAPPMRVDPGLTTADSWVNRPSPDRRTKFQNAVPHRVVDGSKTAEALERLSTASHVILRPDEVRHFIGTDLEMSDSVGVPILLRMVQPETSRLEEERFDDVKVLWDSRAVLVKYMAIRFKDMPLRLAAVVAVLPGEPQEVFVDAVTAIN